MARKLRVEYSGAIYHVMNRGDRREAIFRDDKDREVFLSTLAEACEKTRWKVLISIEPNKGSVHCRGRLVHNFGKSKGKAFDPDFVSGLNL